MNYEMVLYLFTSKVVESLLNSSKYAKVIFNIKEEDFKEFDLIINKQIFKDEFHKVIKKEDILKIKNTSFKESLISDTTEEKYIISINNLRKCISLLTKIINKEISLKYNDFTSKESIALNMIYMLFLRCNINDLDNIEDFLKRQLDFISDNTFDCFFDEVLIDEYNDHLIYCKNNISNTWDETPYNMDFYIKEYDELHNLSKVLYGITNIDNKKVCYIYGVQKTDNNVINKVQRDLYKLNENKENTSVHPNQVLSILTFTKLLLVLNVDEIRIPTMQLLNYSYHEKLSEQIAFNMNIWNEDMDNLTPDEEEEYNYELEQYNKFYNKQDIISKLKTEKLYELLYRLLEHTNLDLINDLYTCDGNLIIRRKNKKQS